MPIGGSTEHENEVPARAEVKGVGWGLCRCVAVTWQAAWVGYLPVVWNFAGS